MLDLGSQFNRLLEKIDNTVPTADAPNVRPDSPPVVAAATPPPDLAAGSCPQLSRPQRFSGESGDIKPFLTQCDLHFELQAAAFPTERAKIVWSPYLSPG